MIIEFLSKVEIRDNISFYQMKKQGKLVMDKLNSG